MSKRPLTRILLVVLAATLIGALNASIVVTSDWAEGEPTAFKWPLLMELTASYAFFLLLPAMVWFDHRFAVSRANWPTRLPLHLVDLDRALRKLRLSGMADVLETRLRQAQSEKAVGRSDARAEAAQ